MDFKKKVYISRDLDTSLRIDTCLTSSILGPNEQSSEQIKEFSAIRSESSGTSGIYHSSHYTQFSNTNSDDSMIQQSLPPTEIITTPAQTARKFHQQFSSNRQSLTATEAVLLGNMFLQRMRRPDWTLDSAVTDQDTVEQSVFGNKLKNQLLEEDHHQQANDQ
jgi:hypothetical protein